jgi:hypothetical protein
MYVSVGSSVKYNPFEYMMLTLALLCVLFSVPNPCMDVALPHGRKELIFFTREILLCLGIYTIAYGVKFVVTTFEYKL